MSTALPAENTRQVLKIMHALMECSEPIQAMVKEVLSEVLANPDATQEEIDMASSSIADALFPNPHKGLHGMDLQESETEAAEQNEELSEIVRQMDEQEMSFASRVRTLMEEQGITQSELATSIGLGQSAIANILSRDCRPQRRTVVKIADALGVDPITLWPSMESEVCN